MVRMKDVLKSYDDLRKEPSSSRQPDKKSSDSSTGSGSLSGLDAIRKAIQSGLSQQKQQAEQAPPQTPTTQQSTLERLKTALNRKQNRQHSLKKQRKNRFLPTLSNTPPIYIWFSIATWRKSVTILKMEPSLIPHR